MSDFVRNLVLRAAGLAPVLKPQPAPTLNWADAGVEEIQEVEEVPAPLPEPTEKREDRVPQTASRPEQPAAPARQRPEPAAEKPRNSPPSPPAVKKASVTPPARPTAKRDTGTLQREALAARADVEPPGAAVEREPVPAKSRPQAPVNEKTQTPISVLEAVVREPRPKPETRVVQLSPGRVREIEFVDRPALPPHVLDQVAAAVSEHVPDGPERIDVHIGRIEIVTPRPPVPAPKFAPHQPKGFAEHSAERRYLRRRWY